MIVFFLILRLYYSEFTYYYIHLICLFNIMLITSESYKHLTTYNFLFSKTNTICKKCAQNVKQFGTVSMSYIFILCYCYWLINIFHKDRPFKKKYLLITVA